MNRKLKNRRKTKITLMQGPMVVSMHCGRGMDNGANTLVRVGGCMCDDLIVDDL